MPSEFLIKAVWVVVRRLPAIEGTAPRWEYVKVFKRKHLAEEYIANLDPSNLEIIREDVTYP